MKKMILSYICGILTAALLFGTISAADLRAQLSVVLNSVHIQLEGEPVVRAGENLKLNDGTQVPYSILYNGTTYLPLRKFSELFQKTISWDQATRTISLNASDGEVKSTAFETVSVDKIMIRVDGYGQYANDFELSEGNIYRRDGSYFITDEAMRSLIRIAAGDYHIDETSNPDPVRYDGTIRVDSLSSSNRFTELVISVDPMIAPEGGAVAQPYSIYEFTDTVTGKYYSTTDNSEEPVDEVYIEGRPFLNLEEIFAKMGFENQVTVELDASNQTMLVLVETTK